MNISPIPAEWLPHYHYNDYQKWEGDWELLHGLPYAMSPSPLRKHQLIGGNFVTMINNELSKNEAKCGCEVLYECDWIVNDWTVVRPDVMILCNTPATDFVRNPPTLILEIFSSATRLKDRNLKFRLYEENGVKYYLMADPERNTIEIFILKNNRYEEMDSTTFQLTATCKIELNPNDLWP